jgi:hypothetical protein
MPPTSMAMRRRGRTSSAACSSARSRQCIGTGSGIRRRGQLGHGEGDARGPRARQLSHDGPACPVPLPCRWHGGQHRARRGTAHARVAAGLPIRRPVGVLAEYVRVDAQRASRDERGAR